MFSSERKYCREGFIQALVAGDLDAATDWLSALNEFQVDSYGERTILETAKANAELNEIVKGMAPGADPLDDLRAEDLS